MCFGGSSKPPPPPAQPPAPMPAPEIKMDAPDGAAASRRRKARGYKDLSGGSLSGKDSSVNIGGGSSGGGLSIPK